MAQTTLKNIAAMLESGKISQAISSLHMLIGQADTASNPNLPVLSQTLREAETVYSSMLRFFAQGMPDPQRRDIFENVREMLYTVADGLNRNQMASHSSNKYFSRLRTARYTNSPTLARWIQEGRKAADTLALASLSDNYDAKLHHEFEQAASELFYTVWTEYPLTANDQKSLERLILEADKNDEAATMLAASSLSALTLGALEFYDPRRLETLMRVYARTSNPQLAARALVGAALLLSKYKSRTDNSRTLKQLAAEAAERPAFQSEMRALVSGMLSTRDTDRISRTITQEIIPDLMKLKPEIEKRFKGIDPEEINEEMPEWMEMIEKSGVEEKLRRFTEMQGEGADVFMAAFSQMKNFPFFNELSNWFLPFSASYSDVHESLQDLPAEWATLVMSMPIFCASDKYSLALSVGRMPAQQAQMMSQQMNAQMSMLDEERKADFQQSLRTSTEAEIGLYLRDLYRFYKLNALRDEFFNPFASTFTLPSGPLFSDLDADEEMLRLMADFYFKHSYWSEAAPLYAIIAASEKADNTDMQKRAYCLEMNGLHSEALEIYRQAEMMEEPDKWLLKRIAALLRATGKPAQAAEYYSRVLEKEPDSLRITMLRGHSLLEAGDVKEALKCYYKVDYLKPDSRRSQRPIAWCEFLLGDYDKAIAKYRKITGLAADDLSHVSADATDSDILNYGHALFASGRIQEAAQVYNLLSMRAGDEKFREMYLSDMKTLREAGLDELTLLLMADAARQQ